MRVVVCKYCGIKWSESEVLTNIAQFTELNGYWSKIGHDCYY